MSGNSHGPRRVVCALALTLLAILVPALPAGAKSAAFTFSPRAPLAGDRVRLTASPRLCGHHRCRYVWQRSTRRTGAKRVRIASGRHVRVTLKATTWIRLTVRRTGASTRHVTRRIAIAARSQPPAGAPAQSAPMVPVSSSLIPGPPPIVCTTSATPATFAGQFAALQPGQTLCLASGDYGTFRGGAKAAPVTVAGGPGAVASMELSLDSSSNLNLQNLTITGGELGGSSHDVTVAGSNFTGLFLIQTSAPNAGILLNANRHVNLDAPSSGIPGRVTVWSQGVPSGVTIANSLFQGGDADGVRPDGDSVQVIGNDFADIVDKGANHADPIQLYGGTRAVIRGNYFHQANGGNISAYIMQADGGEGNVIEDNVFGAVNGGANSGHGVGYGITLMSDDGTVIRHNTFQKGTCDFNIPCGTLNLGNKSGDPVSRGTVIRDNIIAAIIGGSGTYTADHNLMTGQSSPLFVGPLNTYAGFHLASASAGRGAASDGADVGIR